jgi:long-chain acyl-CoA synthetase
MAAVPAILDLIKNGLQKKMKDTGGIVAALFNNAVARKMGHPEEAVDMCSCCSCLDNTILNKVKTAAGLNNVRLLISGGAPLAAETQDFMTAVFAPVAQGYGATETVGCATVAEVLSDGSGRDVDLTAGHVGAIQPATELKLRSVEDMNYFVTDGPDGTTNNGKPDADGKPTTCAPGPRGEILLSGNNVSDHGYYHLPEKTAEDFIKHEDGLVYFHTGDIGVMMPSGNLKIIDRKKDLIKLLAGEYVSLGKVEAALKSVKGIGACVVFAQSNKDHCVVVVSQPEKGWASLDGGKPDEVELLKNIKKEMGRIKMARHETPTKVKVDDTIWTPETGLVTASLKVQRNPLREFYNKPGGLLEAMDYRFPEKS